MNKRTESTFYGKAYNGQNQAVWGSTYWRNEIELMSYQRAGSCWLGNSLTNEEDRRELLYSYLSAYFATDSQSDPLNRNYPNLSTDNLAMSRVLNNICFVYNEQPSRQYTVNRVGISEDLESKINDLLSDVNFDLRMKEIHKICKLNNECAVTIAKENGRYKLKIYTPEMYRAKRDDVTGDLLELAIPFQTIINNKPEIRFHVWTDEKYQQYSIDYKPAPFTFKGTKRNGKIEEERYSKEGMPNPYNRVPFVIIKFSEDPDIYGGGLFELVKMQLTSNAIDYLRDENLIYSGFGIWHFKNHGLKGDEIKMGPGRVYTSDKTLDDMEATIEHVTAAPAYSDVQTIKEAIIRDGMRNLGLPSSLVNQNPGLAQSGTAMLIDRKELEEVRLQDLQILQFYENEIINLYLEIYNKLEQSNLPIIEVETDYVETSSMLDKDKELEYQKALFEAGLISPKQYVVRITGNTTIATDDQAIEYINTNLEFKKQIKEDSNELRPNDGGSDEPTKAEEENPQEVGSGGA